MIWIPIVIVAWLIGGIPFGLVIGRVHGLDIREHGSGNIGATNVTRVLGRPWGILCFVLDAAKGAGPVLAAGVWAGILGVDPLTVDPLDAAGWTLTAAAAVAGHMASPYLRFTGGKGVATAAGALAALWPLLTIPILAAAATWIVTVLTLRWVSLASIAAAASLPLWLTLAVVQRVDPDTPWSAGPVIPAFAVSLAIAAAVLHRHRANIGRLRAGTEPKIGQSKREAMADASEAPTNQES